MRINKKNKLFTLVGSVGKFCSYFRSSWLIIIAILVVMSSFSVVYAVENKTNDVAEEKREFHLYHAAFILLAEEEGDDVSHLKNVSDKSIIENSEEFQIGLKICRKRSEDNACYKGLLASYYFHSINMIKEGLYLANEAAEQGDIEGMDILRYAYATERGVFRDRVESFKWMILLSLQGDENGLKFVSLMHQLRKLEKEETLEKGPAETLKNFTIAEQKAKKWAEEHKNLFFQRD